MPKQVIARIPVVPLPFGLVASPDNATAYVASETSPTVSFVDRASRTAAPISLTTGSGGDGIAIRSDGAFVYLSSGAVIDTALKRQVTTIQDVNGRDIALTPDGTKGYVTECGGAVCVFNTATNTAGAAVEIPYSKHIAMSSNPCPQTPSVCTGDCNNDHSVTIDEILTIVNIALGNAQLSACTAGDANGDHQITVDEILTAVNNALNGCGGFYVRSENTAIQTALTEQRCVHHESLTICPAAETGATPSPTSPPAAAGTPTPSPGSTATPNNAFTPGGVPTATASPVSSAATTPTLSRTPTVPRSATPTATATPATGVQRVDVDIDPRAPVLCASVQGGGCAFVLPFAASGFAPAATFRVAVRTVNPNGRWMISDVLVPSGPAVSTFDAPVDIGAPVSLCCGTAVQAAILVFFNPPAGVPATVDELVDTGADEAFVTEPFTVQTG